MNDAQYVLDDASRSISGFVPKPFQSPSDWNEANRLMEAGAAKVGRWRNYPFQAEPMDAITEGDVRQVSLMWASQLLGKSALITGVIGWTMDQRPASMLFVAPTELSANHYVRSRVNPLIATTLSLSEIVSSPRSRKDAKAGLGGQQLLRRNFPGGWVIFGGSNSPAQLRSHAAKILIADEIDVFEAQPDGDVLTLAKQRSVTFPDNLCIAASTPTFKGASRIESEYELSDQRKWHVSCPHCGFEFVLMWFHVIWNKDVGPDGKTIKHYTDTAHIECPCCHNPWTEEERIDAVRAGRWIAARPEVTGHRGYWLNALNVISPCPKGRQSWMHELAERFMSAKKLGAAGLKTFVNLILAESWETEYSAPPEYRKLYDRREQLQERNGELVLPSDVLVLTAGVDTQDDRLECTIIGWAENDESYVIKHQVFYGDPSQTALWDKLDEFLRRKWLHHTGQRSFPEVVLIDSQGHHAKSAYGFTHRVQGRRIFSSKGVRGYSPNFIKKSEGTNSRLFILKVDAPKENLYSRLRLTERGPGYIHFAKNEQSGLHLTYFEQLCAERMHMAIKFGVRTPYYDLIHPAARNEALDCYILNMGARALLDQLGGIDAERTRAWIASVKPREESAPAKPEQPAEVSPAIALPPIPAPLRPRRRAAGGWFKPY